MAAAVSGSNVLPHLGDASASSFFVDVVSQVPVMRKSRVRRAPTRKEEDTSPRTPTQQAQISCVFTFHLLPQLCSLFLLCGSSLVRHVSSVLTHNRNPAFLHARFRHRADPERHDSSQRTQKDRHPTGSRNIDTISAERFRRDVHHSFSSFSHLSFSALSFSLRRRIPNFRVGAVPRLS